jgi:hypothetical protein
VFVCMFGTYVGNIYAAARPCTVLSSVLFSKLIMPRLYVFNERAACAFLGQDAMSVCLSKN